MIDRKVFEELLKRHVEDMGNSAMVELHLFNGEILFLRSGIEYYDGYFIGTVFPSEPLDPNKLDEKIPKNDNGMRVFDRLMISYQSVSYVRLTANKPERVSSLGFVS